jgi:hypothetical protein
MQVNTIIGLYNVDSVIPNLALMKISAYHKAQGDEVKWYLPLEHYNKVYASRIFTDSDFSPTNGMEIGGSGYDKAKRLPQEIDDIKPDYSIYPNCDYSIGFTTRGCIRKCEFCFVPEMEGKIYEYRKVEDIWRGKGDLVILDNNILAMPNKFVEVLEFCKSKKIHVDFNQGLDCRLVKDEIIKLLIKYKKYIQPEVRFAFDSLDYYSAVENVCKKLPFRCRWYVYCDEDWESALERLLILKRLKQSSWVMRNKKVVGKNFKKWTLLFQWGSWDRYIKVVDFYDFIDQTEYKLAKEQKQGQQPLFPVETLK